MKYMATVNGEEIAVMKFKTRKAMDNYITKNKQSKIVFIKAGTYICTIS